MGFCYCRHKLFKEYPKDRLDTKPLEEEEAGREALKQWQNAIQCKAFGYSFKVRV